MAAPLLILQCLALLFVTEAMPEDSAACESGICAGKHLQRDHLMLQAKHSLAKIGNLAKTLSTPAVPSVQEHSLAAKQNTSVKAGGVNVARGGGEVTVMSYNTQYNNYGSRVVGYGQKIAEVGPAVTGTQECQDKYSLARISGYEVVPGTDFQNPILYKPSLVSFVHGSSGWMPILRDNYSPRTLTWAKFRLGGVEFWFFNTHLPHNHGEASSKNSHARIAQSLLQKRRELGGENMPTMVTGDMNTFASHGASEGSFESNLVDAGFVKSYQARGNTGGHGGLDQIFHTGAHFTLVHGEDRGTGGSDHPAITAKLVLH